MLCIGEETRIIEQKITDKERLGNRTVWEKLKGKEKELGVDKREYKINAKKLSIPITTASMPCEYRDSHFWGGFVHLTLHLLTSSSVDGVRKLRDVLANCAKAVTKRLGYDPSEQSVSGSPWMTLKLEESLMILTSMCFDVLQERLYLVNLSLARRISRLSENSSRVSFVDKSTWNMNFLGETLANVSFSY